MNGKKLTSAERFANLTEKLKKNGRLQIDAAKLELSEQVFQAMENKGMSEAELARRLKVSRAYVNKILQGSTNFTIETLVKIGIALKAEFKFEFVSESDLVESMPEANVLDAEIVYVDKDLPTEFPPPSQSLLYGFKPNGYYDLEHYRPKNSSGISSLDMQYS